MDEESGVFEFHAGVEEDKWMSANSEEEPGDLGLNMGGFLHRWERFLYVILDCIFDLLHGPMVTFKFDPSMLDL